MSRETEQNLHHVQEDWIVNAICRVHIVTTITSNPVLVSLQNECEKDYKLAQFSEKYVAIYKSVLK